MFFNAIIPNICGSYVGESALWADNQPLFRGCNIAVASVTVYERARLQALGAKLLRPVFGTP